MMEVKHMPNIRPVSDLRNKFAEISETVHETQQPIFLTKNGYANMVVMSSDAYEKMQFESEVYFKLREAEIEARITNQRYSHKEVMSELRKQLAARGADEKVL